MVVMVNCWPKSCTPGRLVAAKMFVVRIAVVSWVDRMVKPQKFGGMM